MNAIHDQQAKVNAFSKVFMTIMSCFTSPQLKVAENILLAYVRLYHIQTNDTQIQALEWALNTQKNFLIA